MWTAFLSSFLAGFLLNHRAAGLGILNTEFWTHCTLSALGDLDSCLDILIHVAQRLRDSEDTSQEQLLTAAKKVTAALTKEVGCSSHVHDCTACRFDVFIATHDFAGKRTRDIKQIAENVSSSSWLCLLVYAIGERGDDTDVRGSCFVADRQACREAAFCPDRSVQCTEWGAKDSASGPAGHHRLCKVLQHGRAACPSTEGMFATAQSLRDAGFADISKGGVTYAFMAGLAFSLEVHLLLMTEHAGTAWNGPAMLQIMPGPIALLRLCCARQHQRFGRHDYVLL